MKKLREIEHWKIIAFFAVVYDFAIAHISYFLALWLRFDCNYSAITPKYLNAYTSFITIYAVLAVVIFHFFHMHRIMWRYASFDELVRTILGSLTASVLHVVLITFFYCRMPMSYYVWGSMLQMLFVVGLRFLFRFLLFLRTHMWKKNEAGGRVMVIGAGEAGRMILRDLKTSDMLNDKPVCVIDDNPNKWNRPIEGVPIVGGRETILENVEKYKVTKIFFAVPSMPREERKEILTICNETGCSVKMLPGMYQLVNDQVTVSELRDVAIEDLLGRESIAPDLSEVFKFINGKVVLVTGGGGSIGSELCRQVAGHNPKQLIIFDIYENNAYAIQLELRKKYPDLDLVVLIGSVRDSRRVFQVFEKYHPQIVYHAAAHKHVPLMEDSPCEAIKNNAIGTYKTAYAAMVHGCERFVLISTDKAVNPTNIMGASKRICEMVIQSFDAKIKAGKAKDIPQLYTHIGEKSADQDGTGEIFRNVKTEFVAVRFGNVLGSNGSVIPIFKQQIEEGGPVTVTHPDIIRYFMTVSEAVSLVMLAGTYAHGGEIFVLDMGSPVKIDTLARNMIRLSGLKPDVDIKIEYTGLRPGEKLYEEKLMAEEGLTKTDNKLIHIGQPIAFDNDEFLRQLEDLMEAAYIQNLLNICSADHIDLLIPTIDTDLLILSENREKFEAIGTKVMISAPDKIRICRDKNNTSQFFVDCGLHAPMPVNDWKEYKSGFPAFIKPKDGSSSINAFKVENEEELEVYSGQVEDYIVQPFVSGREYTIDIFCDWDGEPISIVPRERLQVRAGEVLKTQISLDQTMIEESKAICSAFKPCGPMTVQLIRDEAGIDWYIEINPRFGGGAPLSMKAGARSAEAILKLMDGEEVEEYQIADGAVYSRFDQSVCITEGKEKIKGVIFDLDDTLYSEKDYVRSGYKAVSDYLGGRYEEKLWSFFEAGKPAIDELLKELGRENEKTKAVEVYRSHKPEIHLYSGVAEMIEELKEKGIKIGIITDGRPEGQRNKLEALRLNVDDVIITDELGGIQFRKPCDIAFRILIIRWRLNPADVVYVGDNPAKDFQAPQQLGLRSLWFRNKDGIYQETGNDSGRTIRNINELKVDLLHEEQ